MLRRGTRWRHGRSRHRASSSRIDPLTGAGGRAALLDDLEPLCQPSAATTTLLLVDVDGFRALNLIGGEAVGDRVIRTLAERLKEIEGAAAYRLRADVFALLLPAERFGVLAVDDVAAGLTSVAAGVTAGVGLVRLPAGGDAPIEVATVLSFAEHAVREAKNRGAGCVVDFASIAAATPVVTPEKARAMHALLRDGELRVHYQPIVSLHGDTVIGFEALARPQLGYGVDGPEEAFAIAAELGLVPELDAVCRRSIFRDGPGYHMPGDTRLFVNVAPTALGHRTLQPGALYQQVRDAGLRPEQIVFEMRGSATMDTRQRVGDQLRRLTERGYALALDDIGRGDWDLALMRQGLFDVLKVSGEVVATVGTELEAAGILEAVCGYAQLAGSLVIAGGIEDAAVLAQIRRFGQRGGVRGRIQAGQGYHLGRPDSQPRVTVSPIPAALRAGEPATDREAVGPRLPTTR